MNFNLLPSVSDPALVVGAISVSTLTDQSSQGVTLLPHEQIILQLLVAAIGNLYDQAVTRQNQPSAKTA